MKYTTMKTIIATEAEFSAQNKVYPEDTMLVVTDYQQSLYPDGIKDFDTLFSFSDGFQLRQSRAGASTLDVADVTIMDDFNRFFRSISPDPSTPAVPSIIGTFTETSGSYDGVIMAVSASTGELIYGSRENNGDVTWYKLTGTLIP